MEAIICSTNNVTLMRLIVSHNIWLIDSWIKVEWLGYDIKTASILGYSTFIIMEFSFNQHSFINALLYDNSVLYRFYGVKRKIFNITQSLAWVIQLESRDLFQADYSDMLTAKNCFKHDTLRHLVSKMKNQFSL